MNDGLLKKTLRDKLYDGSVPPPPGSWDSIATAMTRRKHKRRAGWMLLGISGVALAALLAFSVFNVANADEVIKNEPKAKNVIQAVVQPPLSSEISQTRVSVSTTDQDVAPVATGENPDGMALAENRHEPGVKLVVNGNNPIAKPSGDTLQGSILQNGTVDEPVSGESNSPYSLSGAGVSVQHLPASLMWVSRATAGRKWDTDACYRFPGYSKGRFFVEAFTGPSHALRSLASKAEDVSSYIDQRNETEFSQLSWHGGVRFGYQHHSGFSLRAGMQYALVNEKFRSETPENQTIITIDSIFFPNDTVITFDSAVISGIRVKQNQNRYHVLDIPILLGYRIQNAAWEFGVLAGPVINVLFSSNGEILDESGMPASLSDENASNYQPTFKDQIGLGIYAGFSVSKRIGSNLYAFVEPSMMYRLKSITLDDNPVDQKQMLTGLSLGVRVELGR